MTEIIVEICYDAAQHNCTTGRMWPEGLEFNMYRLESRHVLHVIFHEITSIVKWHYIFF